MTCQCEQQPYQQRQRKYQGYYGRYGAELAPGEATITPVECEESESFTIRPGGGGMSIGSAAEGVLPVVKVAVVFWGVTRILNAFFPAGK